MDDDRDILTILKRALEANAYEVSDFDNPFEALEYLKAIKSPHLLITDLRMPAMTGFELCGKINKDHPDMGIIVLTAFDFDKAEFERVFPFAKIDALIKKPVSVRRLIDAVNAIIVSKR